jgi:hypothetical protein
MAALKQFSRGQIADQVSIRGEKVKARQFPQRNPAQIVENAVLDFALEGMYGEELQIDGAAAAIGVAGARDQRPKLSLNSQFFFQFASERLLRTFARLNLAARKLPLQRHGLIRTPLANQDPISAKDQSGDYVPYGFVPVLFDVCPHSSFSLDASLWKWLDLPPGARCDSTKYLRMNGLGQRSKAPDEARSGRIQ